MVELHGKRGPAISQWSHHENLAIRCQRAAGADVGTNEGQSSVWGQMWRFSSMWVSDSETLVTSGVETLREKLKHRLAFRVHLSQWKPSLVIVFAFGPHPESPCRSKGLIIYSGVFLVYEPSISKKFSTSVALGFQSLTLYYTMSFGL